MAGIKASAPSKVMADADTSAADVETGYITGEQITLSTIPAGSAWLWGVSKPTASTVRASLSSSTSASPTLVPDVAGEYTFTCTVDGATGYTLRASVTAVAQTTALESIRHQPLTSARVPAPPSGGAVFFSSELSSLAVKDSSGAVKKLISEILNYTLPEDYGAKGDGVTDDRAAIQAAIDAAGAEPEGGVVFFGAKSYRIVGSLSITNSHRGVHLRGAIPVYESEVNTAQTHLVYDSATTAAAMLYLRRRAVVVQNIVFRVAPGRQVRSGVEIDHDPAGGTLCTACHIECCYFQGAVGGSGVMQYGVQIGIRDVGQSNLEFNRMLYCQFQYQSLAGFRQSATTGQSKNNVLDRCTWFSIGGPAIYLDRGSVGVYSPVYSACTVGIFAYNFSDTIYEIGADIENCGRYFEASGGGGGVCQAITLIGARVNPQGLHADGKMLKIGHSGPVNIIGADFTDGTSSALWRADCSNTVEPTVMFTGCIFPNDTPFAPSQAKFNYIATGCQVIWQTGQPNRLYPDGAFRSNEILPPAQTLTGLVAWLDAQSVTQVYDLATATKRVAAATDLSQLGRNAAQATAANQPLIVRDWRAGLPALHFDSTARLLDIADHLDLNVGLGSWLILMVAEWTGASAYHVFAGKGTDASSNNIRLFRDNTDKLATFWGGGSQYVASTLTWPTATPAVIGWGVNSSTNKVIYAKNQTVEQTAITVSGTGSNALAMRLNGDPAGAYPGVFKLGELLVYKRAVGVDITTAQIQALTMQLQRKWNL